MADDRIFPVMGIERYDGRAGPQPKGVPWALVAPCAHVAERNHSQSLSTLASRGGLDWTELYAVLKGRHYTAVRGMTPLTAWHFVSLLAQRAGFDVPGPTSRGGAEAPRPIPATPAAPAARFTPPPLPLPDQPPPALLIAEEVQAGQPCAVHPAFSIEARTNHIAGSNLYYFDLSATCSACGTRMQFRGAGGVSPNEPRVSVMGDTLCAPAVPEGEELRSEEGAGLAGFNVTVRGPGGRHDA
jgi:hypothetical protein